MKRLTHYCLLSTALLAMTSLAVWLGQSLHTRMVEQRTLDDWDIPELADQLNRAGLQVQMQSTRKDGMIGRNAFLTTTDKDWDELSNLRKDSSRIQEWRGTVYCEHVRGHDPAELICLGEDHWFVASPFIFYGDAELLQRISAILAPLAPPFTR